MPEYQPVGEAPGVEDDKFILGYLHCAEWAGVQEEVELPAHVLWHLDSVARATKDCEQFRKRAGSDLDNIDKGQAGHDFWLTRNGHGTGFWDRDYTDTDTLNRLTTLSREFGEQYVEFDGGVLHLA